MYFVSFLVHLNFFSKTCSGSISNKWNWNEIGAIRRIQDHVIDKLLVISLVAHFQYEIGTKAKFADVIIYFGKKFGWTKSETACISVTWLSPPNSELDQKLNPRVVFLSWPDRLSRPASSRHLNGFKEVSI